MSTSFVCPACGQPVPVQVAPGTRLQCPLCGASVIVPGVPPTVGGPIPGLHAVPHGPLSQGLAIASLVFGILGLLTACFPILGLVGLILGIVALVKANNEPTVYGGKGKAIGGICTGAASLVLVIPLALSMSIMLPSLARARELAKRAMCEANMRGIAVAMVGYAGSNGNQFPPSLDVLVADGSVSPKALQCPSGRTPNYVLVPGRSADDPSDTVILYEPVENHEEGGNIGFADGHVEFFKEPGYSERLAKAKAGPATRPIRAPVRPPARPAAERERRPVPARP